jgi:hypothetical protein
MPEWLVCRKRGGFVTFQRFSPAPGFTDRARVLVVQLEATRNAMDYIADMSNGLPGHIAEGELPLCLSAV